MQGFGLGWAALILQACTTTLMIDPPEGLAATTAQVPADWTLAPARESRLIARWSELFDDPILIAYLDQAGRENNALKTARINVRIAEQSIALANAQFRPSVGLSTNVSGAGFLQALDTLSSTTSAGLSISQDIDVSKNAALSAGLSEIQRDIETIQLTLLRDRILADVCRLYISIIEAKAQRTLTETNISFLGERVRVAEVRFDKGLTSETDLLFARANLQSTRADLEQRTARVLQLKRALAALLGTFDHTELNVAADIPQADALPKLTEPLDVLFNRPDVKLALTRVQFAAQSQEVTRRANALRMTVSGGVSGGADGLLDLFDPSVFVASLGASLFKRLYDGGANTANREIARLALDRTLLDLEQTLIDAAFNIEINYEANAASRAGLIALNDAVTAANEALRVEQIKFDYGKSDLLSVLQVQQTALNVNASRIQTQAAIATGLVNAYLSVGAGE